MRKIILSLFGFCFSSLVAAQNVQQIENLILVTLDGFRWQEVFKGVDSLIAENPEFNHHRKESIYSKYTAENDYESRKKILPFIWNTIAEQGQIYGNRLYDNKVDMANPYWFSYPGYSEIFCGFVDEKINTNDYGPNPNTNLLAFLNQQPAFNNKVAAFASWGVFDKILNEAQSGIPVFSEMDPCCGKNNDSIADLINHMKADCDDPFGEIVPDLFTHYAAMHYLQTEHPRVLYIGYGETDEWAHAGEYGDYLDAAHKADKWMNDLWNYVQQSPQYKNKTLLMVTVDHGRGDKNKLKWTSHNQKVEDSHETWFALIGPGIKPKGEVKEKMQIYEEQYAETLAELLGLRFTCEHKVVKGFLKKLAE